MASTLVFVTEGEIGCKYLDDFLLKTEEIGKISAQSNSGKLCAIAQIKN